VTDGIASDLTCDADDGLGQIRLLLHPLCVMRRHTGGLIHGLQVAGAISVAFPLSTRRARIAIVLFGVMCIGVVGCGASVGDVSGKVTYKGNPLKGGIVTLINDEAKKSFTGTINEDGTFSLTKVTTGDYKVLVDTESLKPQVGGGSGGPPMGMPPGAPGAGGDIYSAAKSGKIDVKAGGSSGPPPGVGYASGFDTMAANAAKYIKIPSKYSKQETTDLTIKVGRGSNTLNIDLKD
jgi:hypothetical protein